ncbi:MAG: FoF1 ATP synthase subunit a [Deltaproteobacteria bacterium]|nr:FoF1 ATP synthase subunit a [Deltaproteobacteria bacterium]
MGFVLASELNLFEEVIPESLREIHLGAPGWAVVHPPVILATLFVFGLLALGAVLARRRLADSEEALLPDGAFSIRNSFEVIIEALLFLMHDIIGPAGRKFLPLIGTMALFILLGNLIGLIPGLKPPTMNVNTAGAWAVIVFFSYHAVGIGQHGFGYVKQFLGPFFGPFKIGGLTIPKLPMLCWIMLPIELISHFARMLSLTIRLIGNMFADHAVIAIFLAMVPIGIPVIFMALGMVVSLLQAFIFALLTMVYIGLALEEEH